MLIRLNILLTFSSIWFRLRLAIMKVPVFLTTKPDFFLWSVWTGRKNFGPFVIVTSKCPACFYFGYPLNNIIFSYPLQLLCPCNLRHFVVSGTCQRFTPFWSFHSMLFHWLLLLFSKVSENYRFPSQHSFSEITIVVFTVS